MKKIKNGMILLLVAMVSLCLSGCHDEPAPPTPDNEVTVVGKWKVIYEKIYQGGNLMGVEEYDDLVWIFYDNGTLSIGGEKYDYIVKGSRVYLLGYDDAMCNYLEIEKLTTSTMNISWSASEVYGGADYYRLLYICERID